MELSQTMATVLNLTTIPLEVALRSLCDELKNQWSADQSIFKLIIILCLPQMRDSLETIRLLVQVSKDANEVLYESAQEGHLIQLAIFLMVIREKVLGDGIPFLREIGFGLNGDMRKHLKPTIIQCVVAENDMLDGHWRDYSDTQLLMMYEPLKASADSLLHVFEKAGCAIEKYLKSQDPDVSEERVIGEVTLLLLEAGFCVKPEDVNLSDINRCVIGGSMKSSDKKSERNIHKLPHIRISHKVWCLSGLRMSLRGAFPKRTMYGYPDISSIRLPFGVLSRVMVPTGSGLKILAHFYTHVASREQLMPKFPPVDKIALMIKKGLQRL